MACSRKFSGGESSCPHDGTLLVALMQDPLIGSTLAGCYQIQSLLGAGGMGVVYKARHGLMDRIVAIKMLHANLVSDQLSVARFHQESKAASRINHPHVITIYDFGIAAPQNLPYIVMDYLSGAPLSDEIKESGQISVDRTLKIAIQTCDALAHAHKQGVVHRDLKPGNIVLTTFNEDRDYVKVVDFGVAKLMNQDGQRLTQAGEVCGSPVYMSPEQCMGQELDARSDIYSMGIVLYETLTGKLPILGKTMVETMSKHCSEMPPSMKAARPDLYIPERLEAIIFKALAKDPAARQQSMDELKNDLESAIPRAGRTSTLRAVIPENGKEMSKTVLTKSAPHPVSSAKYSIMFMGLGALLACLVAFVSYKMMTLSAVPDNKKTAILDSAPSKTNQPAKADSDEQTESKPSTNIEKLVRPVRHKLGQVQKPPADTGDGAAEAAPEVQDSKDAKNIKNAIDTKEATESEDLSIPSKKPATRIAVSPEVRKPKHIKHIVERTAAPKAAHVSAPHPTTASTKPATDVWDALKSQLKNNN